MKVKKQGSPVFIVLLFVLSLIASLVASVSPLQAQTPAVTGALHGQVTDPSGAAIAAASVIMTPTAAGSPIVVQSDAQGLYDFKSLPAGKYTLTVAATGFTLYENDNVVIATQALRLNVTMAIEVETTKVQVSDTAPTVDVNPSNNAGAIVISGKELEALPDDPDELQSDLEALAGPSAGPSGGQMYIDGFTAGQLPRSRPFEKSASTRTRSPPSMTSWATAASKSSPSPEPTSSTDNYSPTEMTRLSTRPIRLPDPSSPITRPNSTEISAVRSTKAHPSSLTSTAATLTTCPRSMPSIPRPG